MSTQPDFTLTLLTMIKNNAPQDQIQTFLLQSNQDQRVKFVQSIFTAHQPLPLNLIYASCRFVPLEVDILFNQPNFDGLFIRLLSSNPSDQLQTVDPEMPAKWAALRAKKWSLSQYDLQKFLEKLFSITTETALAFIQRFFIGKIKFIDLETGAEGRTEQERDVAMYQPLLNRAQEEMNNQNWEQAAKIWDRLGQLCAKYQWGDHQKYAEGQAWSCRSHMEQATPDTSEYEDKAVIAKMCMDQEKWDKALSIWESLIPLCLEKNWTDLGHQAEEKVAYCKSMMGASYKGIPMNRTDAETLKTLEVIVPEIPLLENLAENPVGFLLENKRVVGLTLRGLKMIKVPDMIKSLDALNQLDLGDNLLESLPDWFSGLKKLLILNLSKNKFVKFPEILCKDPSVQELFLWGNEIESIPESIGNMVTLKRIDISKNQIANLPLTLEKIPKLDWIKLTGNPFYKIPEGVKNMLRNLQTRKCDVVGSETLKL